MSNKATTKVRGVFEKVTDSNVWWICYFDADGKKRREKGGRKGDAIDLYRKRKLEALQGKKLPEKLRAPKVSFADLSKDALEYSKAHKRSYEDDKVRMAKLREWVGDRPADSLSPRDIDTWLSSKAEEWKPATQNRYRSLLSLIYRLGIQNGKVQSNPARLVRQRKEENARIRFLSSEEEQSLRKVIRQDCLYREAELDVALNTGLRRSEQYCLLWDCVDFERRQLTVQRSKNGEIRHVPLNDVAIAALRTAEKYKNGSPFVFLNSDGVRLRSPRFWFEAAVQEAKLRNFTWHCLRHTFASRLVMKGVDLRTVQELMGHKTISMTVRYAHLAPQHQLAAVQRLCDTGAVQNAPSDTRADTGAIRSFAPSVVGDSQNVVPQAFA
ncbi:MAG TPA: tyrosine-type recombinase/integrase [Candidatus Sulfotelmatobacter sp.]